MAVRSFAVALAALVLVAASCGNHDSGADGSSAKPSTGAPSGYISEVDGVMADERSHS